ncbi:uronyl 2-sulfotransferase [Eurytemora carolleeae]|uniref:uronyl 2-sulfotransferase n=1 Tax=Eurytemora carolleeae TaxID=1294199 RepID=UPI000C766306|nr:uronyl 2-sulfotransferase [Eurytemora carolleeae]|eukprot:XP_023349650.1 uronyl 2-sulfotransferase-like [Eurytemora affinis]
MNSFNTITHFKRFQKLLIIPLIATVLVLYSIFIIINTPQTSSAELMIDTPQTSTETVMREYIEKLPLLWDSGGWSIVDIQQRKREPANHFQQLRNISIHLPEGHLFGKLEPSSENRTTNSNIIIYNRVPKCASTSINNLIGKLSKLNRFGVQHSSVYHIKVTSFEENIKLASSFRKISESGEKVVFDRHFYYVDWKRLGIQPILINMIREPVERVISQFYYLRSKGRWNKLVERPARSWFEKDLEVCVLNQDPECQYDKVQELQITYFCGTEWECGDGQSWKALQKAKYNIEHEYSVVGILENFNASLAVLEAFIPGFFAGASKISERKRSSDHNSNPHPRPSSTVIQEIRIRLGNELELYNFNIVRIRLGNELELYNFNIVRIRLGNELELYNFNIVRIRLGDIHAEPGSGYIKGDIHAKPGSGYIKGDIHAEPGSGYIKGLK